MVDDQKPEVTPRAMTLGDVEKSCVYSDAQGHGRRGAFVASERSAWYASTHTPAGATRKYEIYEFELLAALLGVDVALKHGQPVCILLSVDNEDAHHTIARGNLQTHLGRRLAQAIWWTAATMWENGGTMLWTEYVHTSSSVADFPSRTCDATTKPTEIDPATCQGQPDKKNAHGFDKFQSWCLDKGIPCPVKVEPSDDFKRATASERNLELAARGC